MFAATIFTAVWPRATEGAPSTQASIMSGAALDSRATVRSASCSSFPIPFTVSGRRTGEWMQGVTTR